MNDKLYITRGHHTFLITHGSEVVAIKSSIVKALSSSMFIVVGVCASPVLMSAEGADRSNLPNKYIDMTPFYWTIGIIGGCIGMTLIYVSWKKYKGERHDKHKDQNH